MTTTLRRLAMPVLALAAATSCATACSSSGSIVGVGSAGRTVGSSAAPSSGDFGSSGASDPIASASTPSPPPASGGSGTDAAFCTTFRDGLGTIRNAGSDPTAAADTFDALLKVAPPSLMADIQFLSDALHGGLGGSTADLTKVRDASQRVTEYYVSNCH